MKGNFFDTIKGGLNYTMALQNNLSATTNPGATDDSSKGYEVGSHWVNTSTGAVYVLVDATAGAAVWKALSEIVNGAVGVGAGYKIARGIHTQVAASDTIVTGLATVVAAVISFQSAPTLKQMFATADIGNQSGAPAAGSILTKTFKPTANNDVTPTAATDFTDNIALAWVAVGT